TVSVRSKYEVVRAGNADHVRRRHHVRLDSRAGRFWASVKDSAHGKVAVNGFTIRAMKHLLSSVVAAISAAMVATATISGQPPSPSATARQGPPPAASARQGQAAASASQEAAVTAARL